MRDLVVFGTGRIAEIASYYFSRDGDWRIVGYCVDSSQMGAKRFQDLPIVAFEDVEQHFPAQSVDMFIALGYHDLNRLRRRKYEQAKAKGYRLASYVSGAVQGRFLVGENSLVLDGVAMQPFAEIGNNVFVWGGAMIGHHAKVADHCWITGGANIGGLAKIGEECFFGLNATVGHEVEVGARCLLGANSLVTRCISKETVVVVRDTDTYRLNADQFLRLTRVF